MSRSGRESRLNGNWFYEELENPEDDADVKSGDGENMRKPTISEVTVNLRRELGSFAEGHGNNGAELWRPDTRGFHFINDCVMEM